MWLPSDERRLLSYYYGQINAAGIKRKFEIKELMNSLKKAPFGTSITNRKIMVVSYDILENLNNLLSQRKLITWEPFDSGVINSMRFLNHPDTQKVFENTQVYFLVTLTPEGCDLGRKYNCWWTRSKLWYDEYIKGHWIWLFICFIVGGIITQLINWLWAYLLKIPGAK
jgi:hypothetical protein